MLRLAPPSRVWKWYLVSTFYQVFLLYLHLHFHFSQDYGHGEQVPPC